MEIWYTAFTLGSRICFGNMGPSVMGADKSCLPFCWVKSRRLMSKARTHKFFACRGGRSALDDAMDRGHYLVVNFLADHTGSNVLKGVRYIREMCYAALDGHADLVIRNVRSGVNPNNCLYGARTPLHIAARHGRLKVKTQSSKPKTAFHRQENVLTVCTHARPRWRSS